MKRFGLPQLDLLATLIFAALIAYLAGWATEDHTGNTAIKLTAKIPQSLPHPHIPSVQLSEVTQLAPGALAIAFIGLLEALSIAKAIAYQSGQKIDYNRQIIAEGLANLTGGFFQAVPGSGSVTRSPINYQAGAKTRFSGVIASIGVAIIVLLFAPLLHYMPRAALAGLLLITAARLIDIKRLSYAIKASRYDAGLVIITALVGVFVDLDTAVLLGVALSILLFVPRAAKLKARELVVAPERVVRERVPSDPSDPSTLIYDFEGELFFGAAPDLEEVSGSAGRADQARRHQIPRPAGQAGAPPGRRRDPADREIRSGRNRPRRHRPARRRAGRLVDAVDERRVRQVVPVRAGLPRGGQGILRDAEGGPLRPRTAWVRRIRRQGSGGGRRRQRRRQALLLPGLSTGRSADVYSPNDIGISRDGDRRYVIVGAGAIGGTVGGVLARAGIPTVLVARGRHAEILAANGLTLTTPDGIFHTPVTAVSRPEQLRLTRRRCFGVHDQDPATRRGVCSSGWTNRCTAQTGWSAPRVTCCRR